MSNVGQFIKNKREAAKLSQRELGKLCGTSDAAIHRLEIGETKNPGWELLCKIAKAVGIHPFEILIESGCITDSDVNPSLRLNGLDSLDSSELQDVQLYIDFVLFKRTNTRNQKEEF